MSKTVRISVSLLSVFVLLAAAFSPAYAQKPFGDETSTAGGYLTWDADMIDLEKVSETGAGVYVAVLDTGLVPNYRDFFPEERIATDLGTGFEQQVIFKNLQDPCALEASLGPLVQTTWVGSRGSTHGTHVASTILGYYYRSNFDAVGGYNIPPIMVRGIAPDVTIIPVKVLSDYQVPALPHCEDPSVNPNAHISVFGTDAMIAAGLNYVADLANAGYRPMVVNMSLGGSVLSDEEREALDYAIASGVIVVAAAGNEGEYGMSFPGAYPPVIGVGSVGWTGEWLLPGSEVDLANRYRMWWLQDDGSLGLPAGSGDVTEDAVEEVYVSDFSSRELTPIGQEIDVLAPGSWVRGPYPGFPGYAHLPWWSAGIGDLVSNNPGNFYYVGGTSMATPHVASLAALLLEQDPSLVQADIESILRSTTMPIPSEGSAYILDNTAPATITWDTFCEPADMVCDPVGWGLIQADAALGY